MWQRLVRYVKSFTLWDLLVGMKVTGKYFWKKNLPFNTQMKRPRHRRVFADCTLCAVTQMVRSAVLPVNYAKQCVLP